MSVGLYIHTYSSFYMYIGVLSLTQLLYGDVNVCMFDYLEISAQSSRHGCFSPRLLTLNICKGYLYGGLESTTCELQLSGINFNTLHTVNDGVDQSCK